jgi:hypothetical protein
MLTIGVGPTWDVARPKVRSDGLELTSALHPGIDQLHGELLLSSRAGLNSAWPSGAMIPGVSSTPASPSTDELGDPLLLPDWVTLLFADQLEQGVRAARRRSTRAGDLTFAPIGPVALDAAENGIGSKTLSCDRRHVVYTVVLPSGEERASISEIVSLDPLSFGAPEALATSSQPPIAPRFSLSVLEAPDCKTLYLSDGVDLFWAKRRSCP